MEQISVFQMTVTLLSATLLITSVNLVSGQISNPCTTSMISTFTPCANFITGSINNGATPLTTCCDSLRSLMSTSMDCACLVISANAPILPLPIGQALALSLSQACKINGISAQCKASASPLPPPGPAALGSNSLALPPSAASPLSPQVSETMDVADEAHKYENLQLAAGALAAGALAPASPAKEAGATTKTPAIRPVLTPFSSSASHPSFVSLSPFALIFIGLLVFATY